MRLARRIASWVFWETRVPLGPLAPYLLGFSLGRMPRRDRPDLRLPKPRGK